MGSTTEVGPTTAVVGRVSAGLQHRIAVRRCDTFPGLDDTYLGPDAPMIDERREQLLIALTAVLQENRP